MTSERSARQVHEWTDGDGDTGRLLDQVSLLDEGYFVGNESKDIVGAIEIRDTSQGMGEYAVYLSAGQAEDLRDALSRLLDGLKEER